MGINSKTDGRSINLEENIRLSKIDVLVLSGGSGTRVKYDIGNTPKGLMHYKGKCALDYVTEPFKREIFNIHLNVRYDEADRFNEMYPYDLFVETEQLGNAGALKLFGKELSDPFIAIHNDVYVENFDALDLFIQHCKNITESCCMTVVVKNIADKKEDGIIIKNKDAIIGITRERFINAGIYCISHEALEYIDDDCFQDIDDDLIQNLTKEQRRDNMFDFNRRIAAYKHNGYYESWGK